MKKTITVRIDERLYYLIEQYSDFTNKDIDTTVEDWLKGFVVMVFEEYKEKNFN